MDRQHVNIQHILASLALKATRQSVIIAKLSSYPRKNRTKKALWELDNLRRSLHLLNYVDSPQFQRNIQRALNRGESYHKLVRAVAYANGGKLRVRTDQEQQLWSECSRLLANCIIYYNACILSELLERAERRQDYQRADAIKRAYGFLVNTSAPVATLVVRLTPDWFSSLKGSRNSCFRPSGE